MRDSRTASRKIALCAMLMALAMIFSYVEVLIPINLGVPGIKLGVADLVVVVGLFFLPAGEVLMISVARILLMGYLFGNGMSILYSLAGGLLSFLRGRRDAQCCADLPGGSRCTEPQTVLLSAGASRGRSYHRNADWNPFGPHFFCSKTRRTKEFFAVRTAYLWNFFCVGTKIIPQTSQYRINK